MHASFPRNTVFFSIVIHFLSLSHSLAPDTSLCVLVCMRVQVCEETREKCYMSCQSLCFISLRQDCSLSPRACCILARHQPAKPRYSIVSTPHSSGVTGACMVIPSFSQGSKLTSSYLCSKCYYPLNHCFSPDNLQFLLELNTSSTKYLFSQLLQQCATTAIPLK